MRRGVGLASRVALALMVLTITALGVARPVSAHAQLVESTPSANAVLEETPTEIVLTFDEEVDAANSSITVFGRDGAPVSVGEVTAVADRRVIRAPIDALGDGTYAVLWRTLSVDGHVVEGAFSFHVGPGGGADGATLIEQVSAGRRESPAVARLAGVLRGMSMLGVMVVIGAGLVAAATRVRAGDTRRARTLIGVALGVALIGSVGTFAVYGARLRGAGLGGVVSPRSWEAALDTRPGWMYLVRVVVILGWVGLAARWSDRHRTPWRGLAAATGLLAAVTFSASGHANAAHPVALWTANDALHFTAAGIWIGGLAMLALGGVEWFADGARPAVLGYSRIVTVAVPLIVLTGVAQTLKLAPGWSDLTATGWGRYLVAKVVFVVVLVALGGVSRWVLHQLDIRSVRRTVIAEAAVAFVVVGLAAGLVAVSPHAAGGARPFAATLAEGSLLVDVGIGPGAVGTNEVHITVTPPGGSLQVVDGITVRALLPSAGIPRSPITTEVAGRNHFIGIWVVPAAGDWQLEIIVAERPGTSTQLVTTVHIP